MHLRKMITARAFLLLAGCSQQKIDPKLTQENVIADQYKAKQCDLYEITINELTKVINKAQNEEAIIDLGDGGFIPRSTMISQRLTFAAVTQSNYLQLGAIRGCKFTNVNLPQKVVD